MTASVLWDRFGIGVSTICAIHCLTLPVLISLMPVWSFAPILHEWAHPVFLIILAPVVYFAARRSHYDKTISSLLIVGFILILAAWILGHTWFGFWFETVVTIIGSLILIVGHWKNYRHHQTCRNSTHKHHPVAEKPEKEQNR